MFCDGSARQIVDLLLAECRQGSVRVEINCDVTAMVSPVGPRAAFVVQTSRGSFEAPSLVVATGGLSIPKIGATDLGYRIASQFGVAVVPTRPALVPLLFDENDRRRWGELAGVAADCVASASGASFREQLLFTHRGLSGPAILQASSYWQTGGTVDIDLLPGVDILEELMARRGAGETTAPKTVVARHLPNRLADRWFDSESGGVLATTSNEMLAAIADRLHRWSVRPAGTEGFAKAEVTAGGVDTRALSSKSMEARDVPGLYFIGEVVDVTGHLGGFNFQWAWASAAAAGDSV